MAIVRESGATGGTTPAGTSANDVLVASVVGVGNTTAASLAGWTARASISASGFYTLTILTKVAGGSEPGSYTFTGPPIVDNVEIERFSGVDTTTVISGTPTTVAGSAAAPAITVAANSHLVYAVIGNAGTAWTPPTGMTERSDVAGTYTQLEVATEAIAAAGSTGTRTATAGAPIAAAMLALKEASSSTDVTVIAPTPNATTAVPTATIIATSPHVTVIAPTPNATAAVPTATIAAAQNTTVVAPTPNATTAVPTASVAISATIIAPTPNATTAVPTATVTAIKNATVISPTPNATAAVPTATVTTVAHITIEAPTPGATASVPTAVVLAVTDVPSWDGGVITLMPRAPRGELAARSPVTGGMIPRSVAGGTVQQRRGVRGYSTRERTVTAQQEPIQ